jgi:hypothetical protein
MSFLQPLLLFGLPLLGLPILIHLINRWRHKSLPWGAMMFLLDARRMNRGMARLRFWLIMSMRMLAIAVLFLTMARPLTSGRLGLAIGSRANTTLILLDRSVSMEQQQLATARSKRTAALMQVADVLRAAGRGSRIVLIESTERAAHQFDSPEALLKSLDTIGTATTADLPGLMQTALDYIVANETGRTDIWVCSDLRATDWNPDDGRWASARGAFQSLDGVKFFLLSYDEPAQDNVAVSVTNIRQRGVGESQELSFDVKLTREGVASARVNVPCEFNVNGVRSVVDVELTGNEYLLQGHTVPLDGQSTGGWGRVDIPADENPLDNAAYFVFAQALEHVTTIVADDEQVAENLRMAAVSPLDPAISYAAEFLPASRADEIDFGRSSLILWQTAVPDGPLAEQLAKFVEGGRPIIFFPPEGDSEHEIFGVRWNDWRRVDEEQVVHVASWRGDSDLWAHSASGEPLGIGELRTYAYRQIHSETGSPLARLDGGDLLLCRANVTGGAAYFCATLPSATHSSLAQDGLAFYALVQRALARGAAIQGNAREVVAGTETAKRMVDWQPSDAASREQLLSSRWLQSGAYHRGEERMAVNRPVGEDTARILSRDDTDTLLAGLDVQYVNQSLSDTGALTSEIWRGVLVLMLLALVIEALLCMPEPKSTLPGSTAKRTSITATPARNKFGREPARGHSSQGATS